MEELLKVANSHLFLTRASVLDMKVDAIVNAANTSLLGGGGVDGAIHKAAGPDLLAACRKLGGCPTGSAKITGAYNIAGVKYVIHTVGPIYHGKKQEAKQLADCYWHSLDLAQQASCISVAFPCISCGVYGYPLDAAAHIAVEAIQGWLKLHPRASMEIYLCCFRDIEYAAYKRLGL